MNRKAQKQPVENLEQLQQTKELGEQHQASKFQFISTELDLALTFCRIALSSEDHDKSKRNTDNAEKAYEAASRFLSGARLTESMGQEIRRKTSQLKNLLGQLQDKPRK